METQSSPKVHHGRNIKRLREILGIKQEVLAAEFNITQQAVSDLEKKKQLSDEILDRVAKVLKISVETIKNFNDEATVNIIANSYRDVFRDNSSIISYQPTINQSDKHVEILERLLKAEQEKNALLENLLRRKNGNPDHL